MRVLGSVSEAMHYADIAEEISKQNLKSTSGATPANTVNMYLSSSIIDEGPSSPFERTSRGFYRLRPDFLDATLSRPAIAAPTYGTEIDASPLAIEAIPAEAEEPAGLINALGMYWSRDKVVWGANSRLLGKQAASNEMVDFSEQRGVYLLHDRNVVVYVGRAIDRGIGIRLKEHTADRLNGRWDRFSWFGVYAVSPEGTLKEENRSFGLAMLIATMEALLIESVEPAQNRRRGDDFRAVEFLQAVDPEIEKNRVLQTIREFERRLIV
jgi:hypothetical protein